MKKKNGESESVEVETAQTCEVIHHGDYIAIAQQYFCYPIKVAGNTNQELLRGLDKGTVIYDLFHVEELIRIKAPVDIYKKVSADGIFRTRES